MCVSDVVLFHTQNYRGMTLATGPASSLTLLPVLPLMILRTLTTWHPCHLAQALDTLSLLLAPLMAPTETLGKQN